MKKLISSSAVLMSVMVSACGGSGSSSGSAGGSSTNSASSASSASLGYHTISSAGNVIGEWMGDGYIQLSTGYMFQISDPSDGVSTTAQVASQNLYYTSTDCSGTPYIAYNNYSGVVVQAYGAVNTPSLYYTAMNAGFSELTPGSMRSNDTYLGVTITGPFGVIPTSGSFTLNFKGQSATINWNDSPATIQSKILAGIPSLSAVSVSDLSNSSNVYYGISYQTALANDQASFTITNNTLKASSAAVSLTLTNAGSLAGTCTNGQNLNFLNEPLTPVLPNDPSVTGLSTTSFALPITIQ